MPIHCGGRTTGGWFTGAPARTPRRPPNGPTSRCWACLGSSQQIAAPRCWAGHCAKMRSEGQMVKIMDDVAQTTKWTCCPHIAMGEHRPKLTNTTTLIELDAGHLLAL